MAATKLNLIVAACNNNGIGFKGHLPWTLRKDMDFFRKITMETNDPTKQNAVIMGKKTWFSIPEKYRPLKNRLNIVLSTQLNELPPGAHIARSLQDALDFIQTVIVAERVESVQIIGGSSLYLEAMTGPYDCRIYLTRIFADFECDTFLPEIRDDMFKIIPNPPNIPAQLQEENGIKFRFETYDKVFFPS